MHEVELAERVAGWIAALGPSGIMTIMWWFARKDADRERQERRRLQLVLEQFLPVMNASHKVMTKLERVVGADLDD